MADLHLEHVSDGPVFVNCRLAGLPSGGEYPLALSHDDYRALAAVFRARDAAKEWRHWLRDPTMRDAENDALIAAVDALGGETP